MKTVLSRIALVFLLSNIVALVVGISTEQMFAITYWFVTFPLALLVAIVGLCCRRKAL